MSQAGEILCLTGGIGGAKLALGLYKTLSPGALTVGVNTGDDFDHLGLEVWPDFDTTLYTLSGLSDQGRGWGREGETWAFMGALRELGGPDWFQLGDQDLATHVWRTDALRQGVARNEVARNLTQACKVSAHLLPVTEDSLRTVLDTDEGVLDFQTYFVRRRAAPRITAIRYEGAEAARPSSALMEILGGTGLAGVIIAPSNPLLSIGPILALEPLRRALTATAAPVVAVTPIVGGAAIKGPTAKIMSELGLPVSPVAVAQAYQGVIDGFVLDRIDAAMEPEIRDLGLACWVAQTVMDSQADKISLAKDVLAFVEDLAGRPGRTS